MSNVVIIFPTARANERARMITKKFHTTNPNTNIKMVVASPSLVIMGALNVRDKMEGPSRATAIALQQVPKESYDYVVWWSDECMPEEGAIDNMVTFMKQHKEPFIGEFMRIERENRWHEEGTHMAYDICGHQYSRWGMISKTAIEIIGGFFDPTFHAHWGDVEIALRCWRAGGSVETCQQAKISVTDQPDDLHNNNYNKYFEKDLTYMIKKWGDAYPVMLHNHWNTWNTGRQVKLL